MIAYRQDKAAVCELSDGDLRVEGVWGLSAKHRRQKGRAESVQV